MLKRLLLMFFALGALPDATTVAAKWAQRSAAAANDYAAGVQNTDKDPTALAIQAIPRMRTRILEAIDSGAVANGLRRAGKAGWQAGVAATGVQNYSTGVNAAQAKVATAFGPLLAFEQNLLNRIAAMPNVSDLDRENRMLTWVREMRNYSG